MAFLAPTQLLPERGLVSNLLPRHATPVWAAQVRVRQATLQREANREIAEIEADVGVLRYPASATTAEKPLPHKGPESFPSWTSPVRPRSPALESLAALVSAAPLTATFGVLVLVPVAGRFKRRTASS